MADDIDDDPTQQEGDPKPDSGAGDPNPPGADQLGDPGKRALDAMKAERNRARKELALAQAKLEELDNAGKSELQRATDTAAAVKARADKAESQLSAMRIAMEKAPAHATLAQVRAVAKRVRGDSEDELAEDADELFELLAPKPATKAGDKDDKDDDDEDDDRPRRRGAPAKPKPRMKSGGADPEDEPEEEDPRKLAAKIASR